jgi:hypothetical protein
MVPDRAPKFCGAMAPKDSGTGLAVACTQPDITAMLLALTATGLSLEDAGEELWLHSGLPLAELTEGVLGLPWPDPFAPLRVVAHMCNGRRVESLKAVLERRGIHPLAIALGRVEEDPYGPGAFRADGKAGVHGSICKARDLAARLGANPDWINPQSGNLAVGSSHGVAVTEWPKGLDVLPRGLSILVAPELKALPKRMAVAGLFEVRLCGALEALPEELTAEWLVVDDCPELKAAPERFRPTDPDGEAKVRLCGCPKLEQIPAWGTSLAGLDLNGTGIRFLPTGIRLGRLGSLDLSGTPIRRLPEDLTDLLSAQFRDCLNLEELPYGLTVKGRLNLRGCTALRRLPDNLVVGGDLDLRGCRNLRSLPLNLNVTGFVHLEGCEVWDGVVPQRCRLTNATQGDAKT